MFGYGVTIPNISFFLLVLLFIFSLFLSCSFYKKWRVKHPKQKTKSEISEKIDDMYVISLQEKIEQDRKIENLENRIKELENRKDGELTVLSLCPLILLVVLVQVIEIKRLIYIRVAVPRNIQPPIFVGDCPADIVAGEF